MQAETKLCTFKLALHKVYIATQSGPWPNPAEMTNRVYFKENKWKNMWLFWTSAERVVRVCIGSHAPDPAQVFWSQLASILMYSCFYLLFVLRSGAWLLWAHSLQGAGCSILQWSKARVCVNQPSYSLQKWTNLLSSFFHVFHINVTFIFFALQQWKETLLAYKAASFSNINGTQFCQRMWHLSAVSVFTFPLL